MTTTATPPALLNLSDLSQRIAIRSFYEAHGAIVSGKPTNSKEGKEYAASCPRCGGVDRFSFWDSGRFCCIRGTCNRFHGSSPYWFLRDEGYSHQQALEELDISQEEIADSYSHSDVKLPLFLIRDEPPCKKWIESAHAFCQLAEKCLWSPKGEKALAYLYDRGLKDTTIRAAHLGFVPELGKQSLEQWGLSSEQVEKTDDWVWFARGIVIPWYIGNDIHKIQIRRSNLESEKYGKYTEILGSRECLYSLAPIEDRPVLLVESEFDALSAHQEASDIIAAVATGGTPKGRNPRNLTQLHQASRILQAFDDDPAGHKAATEWQELIPTIERWAPWAHDINDMLREELPIRDWVELGLSNCEPEQGETLEAFWESCTPPALDRVGKEIPADLITKYPDLVERVLKFQDACLERKKICCDTLDWEMDGDGYLICPCVTKARNTNTLLDLRLTQEAQQTRSIALLADW